LIAGTSLASGGSNKSVANNPEKRLARFKREYSQLLVCGHHVLMAFHGRILTFLPANMAWRVEFGK
jgi:hypothetical protein